MGELTPEQWAAVINHLAKLDPSEAGRVAGQDTFDRTLGQIPGLGGTGVGGPQYQASPLEVNAGGLGRDEADRVLGAMGMGPGSPDVGPPTTFDMGPGGQMNDMEAKGMMGAIGPQQQPQGGIDPNVLAALIQSMQAGGR